MINLFKYDVTQATSKKSTATKFLLLVIINFKDFQIYSYAFVAKHE